MAIKRIFNLLKWIGLFIFALTILTVSPIAFLYNLLRIFWKTKVGNGLDKLTGELRTVDYTLDVLGNVTVFNWFDHYTDRHPYGLSGQSVSEVLYYRQKEGTLTKIDSIIYYSILKVDKTHFEVFKTSKKEVDAKYIGV